MNLTIELLENIGPTLEFIKEAAMGVAGHSLTGAGIGAALHGGLGYLSGESDEDKAKKALLAGTWGGVFGATAGHTAYYAKTPMRPIGLAKKASIKRYI